MARVRLTKCASAAGATTTRLGNRFESRRLASAGRYVAVPVRCWRGLGRQAPDTWFTATWTLRRAPYGSPPQAPNCRLEAGWPNQSWAAPCCRGFELTQRIEIALPGPVASFRSDSMPGCSA